MSKENILNQMLKISKSILKAKDNLGKTIDYHREEVLDEGVKLLKKDSSMNLTTFGVKNTDQICRSMVDRLVEAGYLFHTIDKMADGGRAIDVDIINPLTARSMTGSTSGGCVNILLGINDFALGTDGGGSVLAPAISTALYSIMGKGLGLKGSKTRLSTDDITFLPGIGVISHDYGLCVDVIEKMVDIPLLDGLKGRGFKIAIPKGKMESKGIKKLMNHLKDLVEFVEADFSDMHTRESLIADCKQVFDKGVDLIITEEGPIDLYGLGDSVLGSWGEVGKKIQVPSGKGLLKVANMINATAVTIPTGELGMGILIMGKEGIEAGSLAIGLGDIIKDLFFLPQLFRRYFIDNYKREKGGFI